MRSLFKQYTSKVANSNQCLDKLGEIERVIPNFRKNSKKFLLEFEHLPVFLKIELINGSIEP